MATERDDDALDLGPIEPGVAAGEPRPADGQHPWAPSEFDRRAAKPYELVEEDGGVRTYAAPDGSLLQVRAELRGQWAMLGLGGYEIEEVRSRCEAMVRAQLAAWFADEGDDLGLEPLGAQSVSWEKVWTYSYQLDDDDQLVLDDDGEPVIEVDADGEAIKIWRWQLTVEQAYWPPAPTGA